MQKITIVSGCDHNYFPILVELIESVRALDDVVSSWDFCIIDAGMTDLQHQYLKERVAHIVRPDWPTKDGSEPPRVNGRNYIKADVCRPFIPNYFPGYDVYFWIDSDCWVQNSEGLHLFIEGANRGALAVLAANDRAWPKADRISWLGPLPIKAKNFYYTNALKAFDRKTAMALFPHYTLSAGVFALRADAPHWKAWQDYTLKGLVKGNPFTSGQLGMGMAVYLDGLPEERVPAWAHWICQHKPIWNPEIKQFVEPFLPNKPLSILHMTGWDAMRRDRNLTTDFKTTTGATIQLSYRYAGFDASDVALAA